MGAEIEELDDAIEDDAEEEMPDGDKTLLFVAEMCALFGYPIEISLFVNGMVVSGRPITEAEFHSLLAEQIEQMESGLRFEVRRDFAGMLRDVFGDLGKVSDGRDEVEVGAFSGYIHLADVTVSRGDGVEIHIPTWRGHAMDAAGWYLRQHEQIV